MNQWLVVAAAVVVFVLVAVIEARNQCADDAIGRPASGSAQLLCFIDTGSRSPARYFLAHGLEKAEVMKRDWIRQPARS